ncbi:MAG: hypothetical protein HFJ28_00930 [Clostridia bacterium]|jgi:hypothetical protein|nr:hypothetical protein [Clostridia bacterium]
MAIVKFTTGITFASDSFKDPKKHHIIFDGASETDFLRPGVSFIYGDPQDMQQLDLLMEITNVMGKKWSHQLIGKQVRLIVDFSPLGKDEYRIKPLAIGHPTDDQFLLLNTNYQLLTEAEAMKIIKAM